MSVDNKRACFCVAFRKAAFRDACNRRISLMMPLILYNWRLVVRRPRTRRSPKWNFFVNRKKVDIDILQWFLFLFRTWRTKALVLMLLSFFWHERIHDFLHRFSQIVRATSPCGRYSPRFCSCGCRYTARNNHFIISFIYIYVISPEKERERERERK